MEPICFAISLPSIYYALNLNTHALVNILDPSNLISNVRSLNFVMDKSRHVDSKYLLFQLFSGLLMSISMCSFILLLEAWKLTVYSLYLHRSREVLSNFYPLQKYCSAQHLRHQLGSKQRLKTTIISIMWMKCMHFHLQIMMNPYSE